MINRKARTPTGANRDTVEGGITMALTPKLIKEVEQLAEQIVKETAGWPRESLMVRLYERLEIAEKEAMSNAAAKQRGVARPKPAPRKKP